MRRVPGNLWESELRINSVWKVILGALWGVDSGGQSLDEI